MFTREIQQNVLGDQSVLAWLSLLSIHNDESLAESFLETLNSFNCQLQTPLGYLT